MCLEGSGAAAEGRPRVPGEDHGPCPHPMCPVPQLLPSSSFTAPLCPALGLWRFPSWLMLPFLPATCLAWTLPASTLLDGVVL